MTGSSSINVGSLAPGKFVSAELWLATRQSFFAAGNASAVEKALTDATDAAVAAAFQTAIEPVLPEAAAILALEEYGRGEMSPFAGADMLLLVGTHPGASILKTAVADFVTLLWDSGIHVRCTARTLAECLELPGHDMDAALRMLDQRFVAGDKTLHLAFEKRRPAVFAKTAQKISRHLQARARARHARFGDTVHWLEPDVQEGPGGLDDLRLIHWLRELQPSYDVPSGVLEQAGAALATARCFLHYHSGNDGNVFDFEAQEALAGHAFTKGKPAFEWMRGYFRSAQRVFTELRRVLDVSDSGESALFGVLREYRSRISGNEFTVSRERVLLRNPSRLESDAALIFRALEFIGRHGVPAAAETERRLEAARAAFAAECALERPLWPLAEPILASPHADLALRTLENSDLLAVPFPEWIHIQHLTVQEPGQKYTADEHTLRTIAHAAELRASSDAGRARFRGLLAEIDDPALLVFALLFHSMGSRSAAPPNVAAGRAQQAMDRMGVPANKQPTVCFLVKHEFDLAEAMTGRDLADNSTVQALAARVGTIERLKMLAILTYADLAALGPDRINDWRSEQLWRAYEIIRQELTRELETDRIEQLPADLPARSDFIRGFPSRYLRARDAASIEEHERLYLLSRPTGVAVKLDPMEGAWRLTVVARDAPGLFASFAGAISSFGLNILKAEAFANAKHIVLDTFVFSDPNRLLQMNPSETERLTDLMQRVALGKSDAQRLMRDRPNAAPKKRITEPQVRFDSESCEAATLVEIITDDRPGLLYSLATAFSRAACNIDVVLVDTKGHRAIDVFYVSSNGHKLDTNAQQRLERSLLAAC